MHFTPLLCADAIVRPAEPAVGAPKPPKPRTASSAVPTAARGSKVTFFKKCAGDGGGVTRDCSTNTLRGCFAGKAAVAAAATALPGAASGAAGGGASATMTYTQSRTQQVHNEHVTWVHGRATQGHTPATGNTGTRQPCETAPRRGHAGGGTSSGTAFSAHGELLRTCLQRSRSTLEGTETAGWAWSHVLCTGRGGHSGSEVRKVTSDVT